MKLSLHTNRNFARLLLALALFAQGVFAAHACILPATAPAPVMADMSELDLMPCHETMTGENATSGKNACLTHCTQADQVGVDQHEAPAAPTSVIAWANIQPQVQHIASPITSQHVTLDTGPPIPIRFCSLLN